MFMLPRSDEDLDLHAGNFLLAIDSNAIASFRSELQTFHHGRVAKCEIQTFHAAGFCLRRAVVAAQKWATCCYLCGVR